MEFKASYLAKVLNGEIIGNPDVSVSSFARIESGKEGQLSFYANPKYEKYVYTTKASVLIVNRDFVPKGEVSATIIKVDNAYTAIAELLKIEKAAKNHKKRHRSWRATWYFSTKFGKDVYVGAHSHIGRRTVIGDYSQIHENVTIGDDVVVGKNCIFYPGVRIYPRMVIGDNVILHSNVVIGADGFGFAPQEDGSWMKIEHLGNVVIGDDVEIGTNSCIDKSEMGSTIIGNGVKIGALCTIAHNVELGDNSILAGQVGIAGSTKVGKQCIFAGQVGVAGHIKIADKTTVAGQSGVLGNVKEEGTILMGSPAFSVKQFFRSYAHFKKAGETTKEGAGTKE